MNTTCRAGRTFAPGLETLEGKQLLSLAGTETALGLAGRASAAVQIAAQKGAPSTTTITNEVAYNMNIVEGQDFNHVLAAAFTAMDGGKPAVNVGATFFENGTPYIANLTASVSSQGNGRYKVYVSGTCVGVPPVSEPAQLPTWYPVVLRLFAGPLDGQLPSYVKLKMDFAAVPLHAFGSNDTIAATAGVDTGLVDLAGFADSNSQANFYTTKYQVTINWNDPNATASNPNTVTFIGKQKMTVGYVTGSADDWEIYAHHLYAKAGSYPIVITVVKDPPAVGGAGKETLTLHATIVVKALPPPSLVMRSKYLLLSIAGQSPQSSPDAFMAQFTPVLTEPYTAYTFTVNWGDGQTSSPAFREAPGHQPDPGQGILIMDNHVYASGGPPGMPEYYTVTVTITGPGIDPKSPLTGTSIAPVLGQA